MEEILLYNRRASVRRNCADVLRQLARLQTSQCYWLDALRINQADVDERNSQVAMMGSIFHQAEHVLACPGQSGSEGEFVLETILGQSGERSVDERLVWLDAPELTPAVLNGLDMAEGVDATRFADTVAAITCRPYWRCAWMVQ